MLLNKPKNLGIAFIVTLIIAIYGSLLAIDGMKEWYPSLIKPIDIPMWLFATVQPIYYVICITIMYRLLSYVADRRSRLVSLSLLVFMMLCAESWNYFFLGLHSVSLGFWLMLLFCGVVLLVYFNLRKTDNISAKVLLPYLLWLIVDISWIYEIWDKNS